MTCPTPEIVVVGYYDLPLVEAFSIDGTPLWKTGLTDFDPQRTLAGIDPDNGAPYIRRSEKRGRNQALTLTTLPPRFVLLQVSRVDAPRQEGIDPTVGIDSYVLDVDSGLGLFVGTNLPGIRYATETFLGGGVLGHERVPQVAIWKY